MHFEGNKETAVHNHEGAFFIAFLFSDGFCASLIVDPCYDLKKLENYHTQFSKLLQTYGCIRLLGKMS